MAQDRISATTRQIAEEMLFGLENGYDKDLMLRAAGRQIMYLLNEVGDSIVTEAKKAMQKELAILNEVTL